MIIVIDPGTQKNGLAIMPNAQTVLYKAIIPTKEIIAEIKTLHSKYPQAKIVIGNSAFGKNLSKDLSADLEFIDEKNSSMEARKLYWEDHPPKGLWKIIPLSLRAVPCPIDDYSAVILGQRYFKS